MTYLSPIDSKRRRRAGETLADGDRIGFDIMLMDSAKAGGMTFADAGNGDAHKHARAVRDAAHAAQFDNLGAPLMADDAAVPRGAVGAASMDVRDLARAAQYSR